MIGYKAYSYPGSRAAVDQLKRITKWRFEEGGPTKVLLPGDSAGFEELFEIARGHDNWVGFIVQFGTDGGYSGDHLFDYANYWDLDAPETTCQSEQSPTSGS